MAADGDPFAALAALREDTTHGAAEIARQARRALARLADEDAHAGRDDPEDDAREAAVALLAAHPTMAPLIHLADETLGALDHGGLPALADLPRDLPLERQVAAHAAGEIADANVVLTYSRSSTVLAAIGRALEESEVRVLLSEALPGGEGLPTARDLVQARAEVELTYDAALSARVDEAELVLVGADAITADAFVNKTGTRTLLAEARRAGTPTRVLASTDKLWPAAVARQPAVDKQADWRPEVPEEVHVHAPVFERVPLELADRVVREDGAVEPGTVAAEIQAIRVHPDILAALEG